MATDLGNCNNPAPWVHPNGTIYIGCRAGFHDPASLKRADHIAGPYSVIAELPSGKIPGGVVGNYEDPQLFTDKRGHFHAIYHVYTYGDSGYCVNATVSAHAFSRDGFTWHVSSQAPYSTQLELTTGETITLATRERPKPFFQNGKMTHLVQGVCGSPFCAPPKIGHGCVDCKYAQWDYTLVAPLDVQ